MGVAFEYGEYAPECLIFRADIELDIKDFYFLHGFWAMIARFRELRISIIIEKPAP